MPSVDNRSLWRIIPLSRSGFSGLLPLRKRLLVKILPAGESYDEKDFSSVLIVSLLSPLTQAQSAGTSTAPAIRQPAASPTPSAPKPAMQGFGLEDGTPVKLRTARTISSADAHVGDTLDFEVLEEITADGALLIPKGGIAWGTVTEAQPKRRMARGGKLNVNIDSVRLSNGEKARCELSRT